MNNAPTVGTDPSGNIGIFFDGVYFLPENKTVIGALYSKFKETSGEEAYHYTPRLGNVEDIVNNAFGEVKKAYEAAKKEKREEPIEIYGWSRGGAAAYALANKIGKDLPDAKIRLLAVVDPTAPLPEPETQAVVDLWNAEINKNVQFFGIIRRSFFNDKPPRLESLFWITHFDVISPLLNDKTKRLKDLILHPSVSHLQSGYKNKTLQRLWQLSAEAGVKGFKNENYPFNRDNFKDTPPKIWGRVRSEIGDFGKASVKHSKAVAQFIADWIYDDPDD